MEKVKKTRVSHLNLDSSKRMIFMSDIHGDVKLFKESLAGVNFSNDDYLFVIGDLIEKGDLGDNLKMLDYLIELNQEDNVFLMAGNCDEVFRFILPKKEEKKEPPKEKSDPKKEHDEHKKDPQSPTSGIADEFIQSILDSYLKKT